MEWLQATRVGWVGVCTLTAAAACGGARSPTGLPIGGAAGETGSTNGGGGGDSGGSGGNAGSTDAGTDAGSSAPMCTPGGVPLCYASKSSQCLPATDPSILERVYEPIASCGYAPQYVLDFVDRRPLPSSCEPLLDCCSQLPELSDQNRCFSYRLQLNDTVRDPGCYPSSSRYGCSADAGGVNETPLDAGLDAGPDAYDIPRARPSAAQGVLCCYSTCGQDVCI